MIPEQMAAYAASLFLALAFLLRWTYHREAANRMQRSLRAYLLKLAPEPGFTVRTRLEAV